MYSVNSDIFTTTNSNTNTNANNSIIDDTKYEVKNCVIINLDTRPDLWKSTEQFRNKWTSYGKIVERIPGVSFKNKTHVDNDFIKSSRIKLDGRWFRQNKEELLGEFGCYMGHYNCWKYVADKKLDSCLILEDGIIFLQQNFENLSIDKNLDMLYINEEMTIDSNNNNKIFTGYGLQGYIVTQKGANKLLEKCESLFYPIDTQIRTLCNTKDVKGDVINIPFVKRNNNRISSIDGKQTDNTISDLNNKQNENTVIYRLLYNLLEKNVNLDDYI